MTEVNWYTLRRMTPLFDPPQKDDWPMVEIDRHAALAHLSRDVGCSLTFCADDDEPADFVLDRRVALPSSFGTGWTAGNVIETFYVRRGAPPAEIAGEPGSGIAS